MLTDKLEWWNIVPHEREADGADNEADDEVGAGGHRVPVKLLDSDDSDFFDQSELLELKELSNMQKAMSAVAGDQDKSDEKLVSGRKGKEGNCHFAFGHYHTA